MRDANGLFGERGGRSRIPAGRPIRSADETAFAHASERLFARLLDFYGLDWAYEPISFDLADDSGELTGRFTPDFYLPEYDLFVEITTMSQKLVTRKNRKVRLLLEQYPDVRCKVFYQRDIVRLATKHQLEIPTEDYTARNGSEG
jgi:hypoxanthine phosphoribosyltransferase